MIITSYYLLDKHDKHILAFMVVDCFFTTFFLKFITDKSPGYLQKAITLL